MATMTIQKPTEFDELLRYDDLALIKYTAGSRKGRYAVKSDILEEEYHTPLIYEEFDTNEEASEYFDLLIGGSNEIQ